MKRYRRVLTTGVIAIAALAIPAEAARSLMRRSAGALSSWCGSQCPILLGRRQKVAKVSVAKLVASC